LSEIEGNEERVSHRLDAPLVSCFQKLKEQPSGEWWLAGWLHKMLKEEVQEVNGD